MSKRIILCAAAALIAAAFVSCGGAPEDAAETTAADLTAAETAPPAAAAKAAETEETEDTMDFDISIKTLYPTKKTAQTGSVTDEPSALSVFMAKNEREGLQLALSSDVDVSGLTLTCECDIPCELLRVAYVPCGGERLPDPVVPLTSGFKLIAGQNTAVIARFRTDKDTAPGEYRAVFSLTRDGEKLAEKEASVRVWDFALPDASNCRTAFGLNAGFICDAHGYHTEDLQREIYKAYYDYLLDNHICAYNLPYDILDDRADAYMSDPRVNMFVIPYGSDDTIRAYYKKLSSNPEWLKKGVFYPLDEPTSAQMLDDLTAIGGRLSELFPGYRMVTPFFTNIKYKGGDQVKAMTGVTNVWCPKLFCFDTDKPEFRGFPDAMKARQADGDEVWWYVCWEPGKPYTNLYVDEDGSDHRLMFWQQRAADVTGFLYWSANYWQYTPDPWQSMVTVPQLSETVYGDGSILYSGVPAGIDGPCGSLRMLAVSDGVEDFDLLTLAIEKLGRDKVDEIISKVTKSPRSYMSDDKVLFDARREIGEMLEEKMK